MLPRNPLSIIAPMNSNGSGSDCPSSCAKLGVGITPFFARQTNSQGQAMIERRRLDERSLVRYLFFYAKVSATLVVKTDRPPHRTRPGGDIKISVSIDTDQSLDISSGRVRLRRDIRQGDYGEVAVRSDVLCEVSLPLPREGKHLSPGESYESTVVLSLPADAMEDPKGMVESLGPKSITCRVEVSLKTSPRADANVSLVLLESHLVRDVNPHSARISTALLESAQKLARYQRANHLARRKGDPGILGGTPLSDLGIDERALARARATSGQTSYEHLQRRLLATLNDLGIDARALEPAEPDPGLGEGDDRPWGWIKVAEGPIRWIGVQADHNSYCLIPDSRIKSEYPRVSIGWLPSGEWYVNDEPQFESGWSPIGLESVSSSKIAQDLSEDAAIAGGFDIETDLVRGCWILKLELELNSGVWHSCQRVAEALLAMNIPTKE